MNQVLGRVVLRRTDVGIPRLLVTLYDATPPTESARSGQPSSQRGDESRWIRWGSVITDDRGAFHFRGERIEGDAKARARSAGLELVLVVSPPEETALPSDQRRLATSVRRNAGRIEHFLIPVEKAELEKAGIPTPGPENDLNDRIGRQRARAQVRSKLRAESHRELLENIERRRKFERAAEPKLDRFLSGLSTVSPEQRRLNGGRYVSRGESVVSANAESIRTGIQTRVNQATIVGAAALSDEQAALFKRNDGRFMTDISAEALDRHLWPRQLGRGPALVRGVPPSMLCREGPGDPCVEILEGKSPAGPEETDVVEPAPVVESLKAEIPLLVENLVQHMTPPESATIFSVHTRAGIEEVQKGVNGFTLHSGPADAPSLHDFHQLHIAFEHVWQELFDENVVQTGKELYTDLVELGVDPNEYLNGPFESMVAQFAKSFTGVINAATGTSVASEPPVSVIEVFDITPKQWSGLAEDQKAELGNLAGQICDLEDDPFASAEESSSFGTSVFVSTKSDPPSYFRPENEPWLRWKRENIRRLRRQGQAIIAYAEHKLEAPDKFDQFHPNLNALAQAMKEPYRFSIYAANRSERSVNFGIVATYRQKWEPVSYQVGQLVKTVPLSPKEVRRFTKKVAIRKNRAQKEVENNLQSRKTESAETSRAETEIVQKAQNKTNFQMTAEGGVSVGIANAKGSTGFSQDAATESQETKKEFREAVFKAAQEYKSERTTEVNASTAEEITSEESGEISNPNDEITVTYLFYELERRYRVSEQIHRATPIVLVAQEFPSPDEIDEDWIIAHDWILRRVLLDDSFIPAMNYLASTVVGDEHALQEMYRNLQQQRRLADELKEELVAIRALSESRYAAFQKSIERRAEAVEAEENSGGIIPMPVGFITTDSDLSPDAARVREEAAKDAHERAMKQEKEVLGRLERETTALNALTETYTKTLSDHLNRKAQISRLRIHLKANIMHYMQAIWSHEPPDQRFFRLHEVRVPKLQGKVTYNLEDNPDAIPNLTPPQKLIVKCELDENLEFQTLEEVADLDNLLGFKGNYMMFPLRKSNTLTDFMMIPYLDAVMGIRDPDPLGNWTVPDFLKYVCCLREKLSKTEFDRRLPGLQAAYQALVNAPRTEGEEIVVPTDSLFIEALPGVHPILEDFKLFHRVVDVKKIQAEVRAAEFENIRMAARLLAGEREDPTIEKKVVIEGGQGVIVSPDDT
jgi:hypothetical protein